MLKVTTYPCLAQLILLAIALPGPTQAAAPAGSIPMQAAFNPVASDGMAGSITGDGPSYVGGVGGVECQINLSTTDFILDTYSSHNPTRTLTCWMPPSSVIPNLCPTNPPAIAVPASPVAVEFHLYAQNLLGVHAGDGWQERVVIIQTNKFGTLAYSPVFNGGNCSTRAWVKALVEGNSWEITTNPAGAPVQDIAVLYQNTRTTPLPVQYQHLQFDLVASRQ